MVANRHIILWIASAYLSALTIGCSSHADDSMWGAATIPELAEKYTQAHKAKDIKAMCYLNELYRGVWKSPPLGWEGEGYLKQIMEFPLDKVEIEWFAKPTAAKLQNVDYVLSPEVRGKGKKRVETLAGSNMYGRLILIKKGDSALPPFNTLDPAFMIVDINGRYFLIFDLTVLDEAAHSVRTGTPPRYKSGPCVTLN